MLKSMNDIDEIFGSFIDHDKHNYYKDISDKQKMIEEILISIDELYNKEKLSENDKQDIIIKKVGDKYIAYINKRRKEKINEIL